MNQRPRKAPQGEACRPPTDTSGDDNKFPEEHPSNKESRSKNRIPKNIRNDLENALVGLCDVWFEDIKPHLQRNNIKLRVRGGDETEAGGDRGRPPPGANGCPHIDPGAASDHRRRRSVSYAGCCSTLPAVSRVQSHKQFLHAKHPAPHPPQTTTIASRTVRNCEEPAVPTAVDRLRRRGGCAANCRMPRLCRTSSTPFPKPAYSHTAVVDRPSSRQKAIYEKAVNLLKLKNKLTQTDLSLFDCKWIQSYKEVSKKQHETYSQIAIERRTIKKVAREKQRPLHMPSTWRQDSQLTIRGHQSRLYEAQEPRQQLRRPRSPERLLRDISPEPIKSDSRHDHSNQNDLINSVYGEPYDPGMYEMQMYETPRRDEIPDNVTLILSPYKKASLKERPPWK